MSFKKEELKSIIAMEVEKMDFELIDIKLSITNRFTELKLFIDKEGGITINECGEISRSISDLIFRKDLLPKNYRLEVSSPGLDRPLVTLKDFKRNIGRDVILEYRGELNVEKIEGMIFNVSDNDIIINNNNEFLSIPYIAIIKGKIKLKW